MKFLEHIEKIDLIVNEKEEIERRNCLFNVESQNTNVGIGFSSSNFSVMSTGNMTTVGGFVNGNYQHATVIDHPGGFTISGNMF